MKALISLLISAYFFLLASAAFAQDWALPRDADGWSILNPSSDSRIIYVSTTDGNNTTAQSYTIAQVGSDPRHPTINIKAYATIDAALTQMRDTYPDWILLKAGDTFTASIINLHDDIGGGRSKNERKLFTWYGNAPQRPVILNPDLRAWRKDLGLSRNGIHHWAFVGIEFYNASADPNSPNYISSTDRTGGTDFLSGGENLLIEDCKFSFWGLGIQGPERRWVNVEIRRNILENQYYHISCNDRNRRPSAVYLHAITNYLIEENITDYAGWNPDIPDAGRNAFNHGFYIQFTCDGQLYFRGNIITRASGNGAQNRSGGLVEKNLVLQSPAGLFVAHDTVSGVAADPGLTAVRHNVIMEGLRMGNCPQATSANWGIPLHETLKQGTVIEENIVAHNLDGLGTMGGIDNFSQCTYIHNIVYDWGTVANIPNTGWSNPQRSVGGYHATIGGAATTEAFIDACVNRALRVWPYAYSAYAVIDYIREGFNLAPVGPGGSSPVAVTGVSVTPESLDLFIGNTSALTAQITPLDASNRTVAWSSSDTAVATVNSSGVVSAVDEGTATITATTSDGSFTDAASVTVTASTTGNGAMTETLDRDYWLSMPGSNISVLTGNAKFPSNPDQKDALGAGFIALGWAGSANPGGTSNWGNSFAQRIYGYLVPKTSGNYVFWISSDDHSVLYLSTNEDPGNRIEIASVAGYTSPQQWNKYPSQKSVDISLRADSVYYIEALHKEGGGGTSCAVGWAKPGESISAPSEIIPPTVLSAYSAGVPSASIPVTAVTAVTVSPDSLNLTVNNTVTLTAQISPLNATDPTVAWSSSNTSVATVDSTGKVSAVAAGSATITATTNDGSFTDTAEITVVQTFYGAIAATLGNAETESYQSEWLGLFREMTEWSGWCLHANMGWFYPAQDVDSEATWLWLADLNSWAYTTETHFPWIYSRADSDFVWLYLLNTTTGNAWYYHAEANAWAEIIP